MTYARGTTVTVEQTRMEIERIITRYGATAFSYATNSQKAQIQFEARDRVIRFVLPLPAIDDPLVVRKKTGKGTTTVPHEQRAKRQEQLARERWRALKICILSKLEAVGAGITQFEEEFFSHIVDPQSGRTVYELVSPQLKIAYSDHPKPIGLPSPDSEEIVQ
jgi:hypothetical protein